LSCLTKRSVKMAEDVEKVLVKDALTSPTESSKFRREDVHKSGGELEKIAAGRHPAKLITSEGSPKKRGRRDRKCQ